MAGATIEVEGARQLRASLRKAGIDMRDLKAANRAVSEVVAARARQYVPRKSGRLASTVRPGTAASAAIVRAGNNGGVPYGKVQHWGWRARNIQGKPFVLDAARDTQSQWLTQYQDALQTIIDTVEGAPGK